MHEHTMVRHTVQVRSLPPPFSEGLEGTEEARLTARLSPSVVKTVRMYNLFVHYYASASVFKDR